MSRLRNLFFILVLVAIMLAALLFRSPTTQAVGSSVTMLQPQTITPLPTQAATVEVTVTTQPTLLPPTLALSENDSTPLPDLQAFSAEDLASEFGPDSHQEADPSLQTTMAWSPPPLPVPLARHPNDHYWFQRPVSSNHINTGLIRYPYGSTGSTNELRVHHGIDISNPTGTEVLAVADGIVVETGMGHINEWESITSYGNAISIEHDVGYQGKKLYTLYAHLSQILVQPGQRVTAGQVIGLVGQTGQATGPHVHFEIRLERNAWRSVRNPDLWLAPYTGTGIIAGRLTFSSGNLAENVEIIVVNLADGQVVYRTTTYASAEVSSDDRWNENFVLSNVPLGRYLLTASYGALEWSGEVTVQEGLTNWVDMALEETSPTSEG